MTTARPSGWRTLMGASPFAIPLVAWLASASHVPAGYWVSIALLPACLAAVVDTHTLRLPDELLAITAAVVAGAALAVGQSEALLAAAVAGGSVLGVHLINPLWFGFGDVKLAGVLGAAVGLVDWRLGVWTLGGAAVVGLLTAIVRRSSTVAFGPALVGAAAVSVMVDTATRGAWR